MRYNAIQKGLRITAAAIAHRRISLTSEGLEHVPQAGAFILAVRHYHHLFDGAVLYKAVHRPLHVFVALDWAPNVTTRTLMEGLCRVAGWPIGLRNVESADGHTVYRASERINYLRRAFADTAHHLKRGDGVVFFPEGKPVIDPHATSNEQQSFASGLCLAVEIAQRKLRTIPIIPIGLDYSERPGGYNIILRCGPAIFHAVRSERGATMSKIAEAIRLLSYEQV